MKSIRLTPALARTASTIAITACLMMPGIAAAQDAPAAQADQTASQDEGTGDDIVVTGIRASLDRAIDIKRNSSGVVDAISAEDIGKFPDTNLAESLQRIPGVSINRVNGEGSEVTARGFGGAFNLVTLNGRTLPAANVVSVGGDQSVDFGRATSRSFDFSNLASEGVSRLEVYKTGRAAIPSGGIGASINVVTRKPLDGGERGFRGSIGAKAVIDSSVDRGDKVTPEVSGLVSWSNEADSIGVSLFGSYQKRDSAAASATSNAWNIMRGSTFLAPGTYVRTDGTTQVTNPPAADDLIAVPNDSRYHFSESERERINFSGVLQFRPVEGFTISGDALWVQNKSNEARSDQGNWFNRPFNQVRFNGNDVVSTTEFLQETIAGVKDAGFEQQYRATKDKLESYGLNLAWEATDTFSVKLDGHISTARSDPDAPNGTSATLVSIGAPVIASHSVDFSGEIPVQSIVINDALRGNNNGQLDLGDLGSQVARTNASSQRQKVKEARLEMGWDAGGGSRFDFGGSYIDSEMTSARIQTQQTLGDWGITYPGDVNLLASGLVEQFCLTCKFDKFNPGTSGASLIGFRGNAVDLYNALSPAYAADSNPVLAGVQAGRPVEVNGNDYDRVREKTWSVFGQVTWEGEIGGMKSNMVAGVRYEKTDVDSYALVVPPSAIRWTADNDFTRVLNFSTPPVERNGTGSYSNFLPALDFSIEPFENFKARASFSRTLARPEYGNLFVSEVANAPGRPTSLGGEGTGTRGNPNLQPLLSDNLDLSLEWYFAPSSYVSAGFFHKSVRNFVGSGQSRGELFGLRDPTAATPGSRSGAAATALAGIGANRSDVNLFTMTALIIQNGGSVAAATTQFQANRGPSGDLNQGFVDSVLAAIDISADANDPLFNFVITSPINNREAKIHGFELAGAYFFGQTGFGIAGSYTIVRGDVNIDPGADPAIDQFALLGLSDSFNVTAMYDKGGISARLTYNWRDKYLSQTNRDGSNRNPTFIAPFGTLDANISLDVTQNIALSFEAINITSEPVRTYGRTETNLYFAQELKPRYLLGARFRF
ncbi:TonB-dependent receptor [Sphingomonas sp. DG1-23]|uniref:TonB-dependent receptor n=1 Tax=Sphingomonas sp. DG1-23 TaxID=3068316 RepID=UPI00273FA173|nr:TonB-dependent receptor [Sphingomonas sp. DG1-23]MDP5279683.1 TonB-dependent receptor [Sphingomonas sp. DG1-23]